MAVGTTPLGGPEEVGSADEQAPDAAAPARPRARRAVPPRVAVVGVLVLAALGFLVFKGLGNATVYFKTADEAVAARQQLGTHRFRIEGVVVTAPERAGNQVRFTIANNDVQVPVVHDGDPPELFRENIPVVLEGHFDASGTYRSDRILVKHSATYIAKNPQRVKDYGGR